VTGVALNVNPVAAHDSICPGDSTRLYAVPGGGNVGHYNYSWSSIPPGFTSSEADPMVSPRENTTYQISLFDQFNTIQGSVNVILFQKPAIHLGPADSTVCIYDTVELDAGNPGSDYLWSNGAITGTISFGTTGIGYDAQTYSVVVTNRHGCRSDAAITVIFATDACTGIGENGDGGRITLYPNPARDRVAIGVAGIGAKTTGALMTPLGKVLQNFSFRKENDATLQASVDLTGLPKGIYLVKIETEAALYVRKLVVE